jgi:hypothetical protein
LTDADAEPGPRWILEMAAAFKPDVVMVCGYSPYWPRRAKHFGKKFWRSNIFHMPLSLRAGPGSAGL